MKELLQNVLDGDTDAFRGVVVAFGPAVRAYLAGRLPDPHTVDDLAQETFIAAYESLERFDPSTDMGLWLRGIARNKLNMHLRRTYRRGNALERLKLQVLHGLLPALRHATATDDGSTIERLRECVAKLPEQLRRVVTARYFDRAKVQDIAERLGKSATAVSSLLFRARKDVQLCMEKAE
ncbi:MAG: sigma-70 family RNA polymerase sigma factor [Kiritimatiellae bacterium]|nr:sigma-70 family RNA polymerase sigma factor [Kiritimatiellia bacterium]